MEETRLWSLLWEIPHALEQLSPYATTTKPVPQSLGTETTVSQLLKPEDPRVHALKQEKPPQWEALQLEKSLHSNRGPAQPKINNNKIIKKKKKNGFNW